MGTLFFCSFQKNIKLLQNLCKTTVMRRKTSVKHSLNFRKSLIFTSNINHTLYAINQNYLIAT